MSDIVWQPVTVQLSALVPWDRNPKTISKTHAKRMLDLWQRLGQFQTIAIGPAGEVYDGHQRLSVLKAAHGPRFEVTALQSDRALTEKEREELTVAAHVGTTGQFNWDDLSGWDAGELQSWGFDAELLQDWNAGAAALATMLESSQDAPPDDPGPQIDRAEELREKWGVESGQLWQLGEHRLICGDCTDAGVVARVMGGEKAALVVTDPPYGVEYADKNKFLNAISRGNHIQTNIEGDHGTREDTQALWKSAFIQMNNAMLPGAVVYCFMPQGGDQMMMMMMMMMAGIEPRHELIWLKNNHVLGRVDYAYKHEPILYAWKDGGHKFYGDFQTSILEFPKPLQSDLHPTTKPVELIERLVSNSSVASDVVCDPFLGSGTTLIACERLNRRCRGVEISPAYVAVTLQRWADLTGGEPVLVTDEHPRAS